MAQISYGSITITDIKDIDSIVNYYLATDLSQGVTTANPASGHGSWSTTIQNISENFPYLWNYERILGTGGELINETAPVIIGHYGEGGAPGRGILRIDEYYKANNSPSQPPTTWNAVNVIDSPTNSNKYLWNYQVIVYDDGNTEGSAAEARIIGVYGDSGSSSATVYLYIRSATTPTILPTGNFTYTFSSNSLTGGNFNNWSTTIPSDSSDPIWVITSVARSTSGTATVNTWSSPVKLVENGVAGTSIIAVEELYYLQTHEPEPTYTVTYRYSGTVPSGVPALPAQAAYHVGDTVTVTTPTMSGYTFSGWKNQNNVTVSGSFTMTAQNVELTGSWTSSAVPTYTVTYSYTGTIPSGVPAAPIQSSYAAGATVTVASVPTLDGYVFSGWMRNNAVITGTFTMPSSAVSITGYWTEVSPISSDVSVDVMSKTLTTASNSIQFTGLAGEPTSFVIAAKGTLATGAAPYKTASVVFDGTNLFGDYITNTNNAQVSYSNTAFTKTYNNGTLVVTGSNINFQAVAYDLIYSYNGSSNNVKTKQVQVGSGATNITFSGLEQEPLYFSCAFQSTFSTSSGYQRVITVWELDGNIYGLEMDSSAKYSNTHWGYTYNNGSLTISSSGTNQGGYFHQPGNYQLTYVVSSGNSLRSGNVSETKGGTKSDEVIEIKEVVETKGLTATRAAGSNEVVYDPPSPPTQEVVRENYILSEDTSMVSGKDYYSYNSSTNTYTKVTNTSGNPKQRGWYELRDPLGSDYWTFEVPTYIEGGIYYSCLQIYYSNNTVNWSEVRRNQGLTDSNSNALEAKTNAESAHNAIQLLGGHFVFYPEDLTTNTRSGAGVVQNDPAINSPNSWGYNTWISSNGIQLRTNETPYATLNANGLIVDKGGIISGNYTSNPSKFLYLSTEDYSGSPTITINNNSTGWRQIIGTKFGVKNDGTLYASNVNISGTLNIGAGTNSNIYTKDESDQAINNITIGGRNLLLQTNQTYVSNQYLAYAIYLSEALEPEQQYILQLWDVHVGHSGKSVSNLGVDVYYGNSTIKIGGWHRGSDNTYFTDETYTGQVNGEAVTISPGVSADHLILTFTPHASANTTTEGGNQSSAGGGIGNLEEGSHIIYIYNSSPSTSGTLGLSIGQYKLEKGTKPTEWSVAPEDTTNYIESFSAEAREIVLSNVALLRDLNKAINFEEWIQKNGNWIQIVATEQDSDPIVLAEDNLVYYELIDGVHTQKTSIVVGSTNVYKLYTTQGWEQIIDENAVAEENINYYTSNGNGTYTQVTSIVVGTTRVTGYYVLQNFGGWRQIANTEATAESNIAYYELTSGTYQAREDVEPGITNVNELYILDLVTTSLSSFLSSHIIESEDGIIIQGNNVDSQLHIYNNGIEIKQNGIAVAYFGENIILGSRPQNESSTYIQITPSALAFFNHIPGETDSEVASITSNALHIATGILTSTLQVGQFAWRVLDNNNRIMLVYTGTAQ